jgi:hypothetical protein
MIQAVQQIIDLGGLDVCDKIINHRAQTATSEQWHERSIS